MLTHTENFLLTSMRIINLLKYQYNVIDKMTNIIKEVKMDDGRLFLIGMGGGAGNASHAVNDFRKLCGVNASTPTDNVSELTARANDEGLDTIFTGWLKANKLNNKDCLFIFSVGGGDVGKNVSMTIVKAIDLAIERNAKIIGVVGRDGGYTASKADACVIIPNLNNDMVTPQTEGMQAVIWHLLVSNSMLQENKTKW
jgi:D-sedoheptulose 7-phosphate isomerase